MYKGLLKDLLNVYLSVRFIWMNLFNIYEVVGNIHYNKFVDCIIN